MSSSYLTDRTHYISLSNHCSAFAPLHSGVPQGSVLGLIQMLTVQIPTSLCWKKPVLSQVSSYLNSHNLYNTCQSAYRPGQSTETALLKVVNDMFLSLIKGNISVLALHDLSSAFDTIDRPILVHHLHTDFGSTDTVLQWFSSYLTDRTHYISLFNHYSTVAPLHSGVPQGSVLGPIQMLTVQIPTSLCCLLEQDILSALLQSTHL